MGVLLGVGGGGLAFVDVVGGEGAMLDIPRDGTLVAFVRSNVATTLMRNARANA
jgi:hypothetical protein